MRIRQVALAASDLEKTDEIFRRLFGCDESYADPEIIYFGLDNRLYTSGIAFSRWSARLSQIQPRVVFLIAGVAMVLHGHCTSRGPHSGAGPFSRYVDTYGFLMIAAMRKPSIYIPKMFPARSLQSMK